ncbi:K(+)-transporting ATPase subunit F [Streptomonospora sediminis]
MNWDDALALIIAIPLAGYLLAALLAPERF